MSYFRVFKSQLSVIEQALETSALMLGSDKSRGYCLEMICGDFLAGASLQEGDRQTLLISLRRLYDILPKEEQQQFAEGIGEVICRP